MAAHLKIPFVSPEVVLFPKTGELVHVVTTLRSALQLSGVDARVVLPLYRLVRD